MCCFHFVNNSLFFTANLHTLARPSSCWRSLSVNVYYNTPHLQYEAIHGLSYGSNSDDLE